MCCDIRGLHLQPESNHLLNSSNTKNTDYNSNNATNNATIKSKCNDTNNNTNTTNNTLPDCICSKESLPDPRDPKILIALKSSKPQTLPALEPAIKPKRAQRDN